MVTLKAALDTGNLDQFIVEREADEKRGDEARFNATLAAMARTSKAVPATSDEAPSAD